MISNTSTAYGGPARLFHWLTALLILTAIGLGLYAESLPRGTDEAVSRLAAVFSLHKTIGVTAFFVAVLRILWALSQPKPVALHPQRRLETFAAEVVHWALYGAMLLMPLSGWIGHAAQAGFAPILWPFGQTLFFVPQSPVVAETAETIHKLAAWVLYASIALHVAGAAKHVVIDRDATLARMLRGTSAGTPGAHHLALAAPLIAALVWLGVIGAGLAITPREEAPVAQAPAAATSGNWQVSEGTIGFDVTQMGSKVAGSLPRWTAEITYDEASGAGDVTVTIDTTALTIGTVTDQAKAPEFFDTAAHPTAVFKAAITRKEGTSHEAAGTLTLRGTESPVTLPFTLTIEGSTAHMAGDLVLDRRAFGMGPSYPDESNVGFSVPVHVALTATRR
jgi:cytochrome b561/polyisoprenoid-binding protein YceI